MTERLFSLAIHLNPNSNMLSEQTLQKSLKYTKFWKCKKDFTIKEKCVGRNVFAYVILFTVVVLVKCKELSHSKWPIVCNMGKEYD